VVVCVCVWQCEVVRGRCVCGVRQCVWCVCVWWCAWQVCRQCAGGGGVYVCGRQRCVAVWACVCGVVVVVCVKVGGSV